jgi:alkylation response protein AidB-like acyl-CoA dehydrogenase
MEFLFSDEHKMLRETVKKFVDAELRPKAHEIDKNKKVPEEILKKMAELGFFGVPFPEEYGGSGLGKIGYCILIEELTRGCASTAIIVGASVSLCAMPIFFAGTEEQKRKYLIPLIKGEKIGALAMTESQAGSDAANIRTTAEEKNNEYIINGEKIFITNGDIADFVIVTTLTNPALGARGGITTFIVEKGMEGFKVERVEDKMGLKGSGTAVLSFQDVKVPKENMLGKEGEGFKIAMQTLDGGRLGIGAGALGLAKEALDLSIKHSKERVQFDRPICENQAIQWMLAEMAAGIYAMESILYRTAYIIDKEGKKTTFESAIVKMFCSETADDIIDKAVQIHGGMGYMSEYPIERMYRDSRINRIFEGTNEIQRIVIARELLKKGSY